VKVNSRIEAVKIYFSRSGDDWRIRRLFRSASLDEVEEDGGVILRPEASRFEDTNTPFLGNLILVMSTEEGAHDRAVRVGVAAAVHDVDQGVLERWSALRLSRVIWSL
jgi:hypothetical protein